jgi:CBS domain-containing protein
MSAAIPWGNTGMKVLHIMSRSVESVTPTTPIAIAAEKMRDLDIGFLPVCENDRLLGTVTDRDITVRSVAQGRDPRLAPVSEIMTPSAFHCYEDEEVEEVARQMQDKEVRRILIVNREGHLSGVVSLGDIARTSGETGLAGETLGEIAEAA